MAKQTQPPAKKTLRETLNDINFKNAQAQKIQAVQEGKERLKDSLGRNKKRYVSSTDGVGNTYRRVSAAGRIKGLQTL